MTTILQALQTDRDDQHDKRNPYRRPRDAATLILVDRTQNPAKVLLGRRHTRHVFMPGKFVFPGGRLDPADRYAPAATPLDMQTQDHLMQRVRGANPAKARALALAAVRETFEETGLLLGVKAPEARLRPGKLVAASPWAAFIEAQVLPDLASIAFIARAITPTGRPRRYDTRFFTADASAVAHRVDGMVGEDSELIELVWVPIAETQDLDLPGITRQVLHELEARIAAGFGHDLPVPFIHAAGRQIVRELI